MAISLLDRLQDRTPEARGPAQHPVEGLRTLPVTLYTAVARVSGVLPSVHWRLSDTLNAVDQDFLLLRQVRMRQPQPAMLEETQAAQALVRIEDIILAVPGRSEAGTERPPARQGLMVERRDLPVLLEAWPYSVSGRFHVAPGVELLQHVHTQHRRFLPVSEARVISRQAGLLGHGAVPFVLVNRQKLQLVLEAGLVGKECSEDPEQLVAPAADLPISPIRAAEILNATRIFGDASIAALESACELVLQAGALGHKLLRAGLPVFEQGDSGDTLYAVERGHLEVSRAETSGCSRTAGYLGPGDVFGEMAVLGDRKRSMTVRAVTDASLVAVSAPGVEALLKRFPSATGRLMKLVMERGGGLPSGGLARAV